MKVQQYNSNKIRGNVEVCGIALENDTVILPVYHLFKISV